MPNVPSRNASYLCLNGEVSGGFELQGQGVQVNLQGHRIVIMHAFSCQWNPPIRHQSPSCGSRTFSVGKHEYIEHQCPKSYLGTAQLLDDGGRGANLINRIQNCRAHRAQLHGQRRRQRKRLEPNLREGELEQQSSLGVAKRALLQHQRRGCSLQYDIRRDSTDQRHQRNLCIAWNQLQHMQQECHHSWRQSWINCTTQHDQFNFESSKQYARLRKNANSPYAMATCSGVSISSLSSSSLMNICLKKHDQEHIQEASRVADLNNGAVNKPERAFLV